MIQPSPMDSAVSPKPANSAKTWIVLSAAILIVTPFVVLALKQAPAASSPATAGMAWIPGGEFTMGSDKADEKHAEEAPGHAVVIKGFWMDVTEVTNAQFQAFVDATKYLTDAEKDLDPRQFPDAPPEFLKGGSLLFKKVSGVNPFQCGGANLPWWNFTAGANWRQPEGPNSSIKDRANHPVLCLTYKDVQAYAKWAGKRLPTEAEWGSPPAAASRINPTSGAMKNARTARLCATIGRASSRNATTASTASPTSPQ